MSEATHYWPDADQPGEYIVERSDDRYSWEWNGSIWIHGYRHCSTEAMKAIGYLGVRREAEKAERHEDLLDVMVEEYRGTQWKPDNATTAQQALDEWRAVKQAPKAADWAYRWAVTLCEIAGAR